MTSKMAVLRKEARKLFGLKTASADQIRTSSLSMDSRVTQCSTAGNVGATVAARPCTVDLPANVTSFA